MPNTPRPAGLCRPPMPPGPRARSARVSCAACGAPNPAHSTTCEYCLQALPLPQGYEALSVATYQHPGAVVFVQSGVRLHVLNPVPQPDPNPR